MRVHIAHYLDYFLKCLYQVCLVREHDTLRCPAAATLPEPASLSEHVTVNVTVNGTVNVTANVTVHVTVDVTVNSLVQHASDSAQQTTHSEHDSAGYATA